MDVWDITSSFINVADLYTYLVYYAGVGVITTSSLATLQSQASAGNIVQIKRDGVWFHSVIITGGTTGNLTYCGHTNDWLDNPVSSFSEASPVYTDYRIIRVH